MPDEPTSFQGVAAMNDDGFEAVDTRVRDGHAVYLRGRRSGRVFRISPVRDPVQPRLWCLLVERCASAAVPITRGDAVIGTVAATKEEALTALRELEKNPTQWLGQRDHRALRAWLRDRELTASTADA
jgi:hypothetical protein